MPAKSPIYLDCNASTPMEPAVLKRMLAFWNEGPGNAGSRTHYHGARALSAVEAAREQVAGLVGAQPSEVIFTSGATEANNLAILGLREHGAATGKRHIVTTSIEHKAVLEPLAALAADGFDIDHVPVGVSGRVEASALLDRVRADTLMVSMMHANNETGILQPVEDIASELSDHDVLIHVDAAQTYGRTEALHNRRLDLISISAHKIYGPVGVGALIARRRRFMAPPIRALYFGGGQERGRRPGTLAAPLIVGLGAASSIAQASSAKRDAECVRYRERVMRFIRRLSGVVNGDPAYALPHVVNVSFPGITSEAALVTVKDLISISNGSACTTSSYSRSHVLCAMQLPKERVRGALRISWSHLSEQPDWEAVEARLRMLLT